jgi:hypothetical protein
MSSIKVGEADSTTSTISSFTNERLLATNAMVGDGGMQMVATLQVMYYTVYVLNHMM